MQFKLFLFTLFNLIFISTAFAEQQLIIEPDMGSAPIINAIDRAQNSIDLVMYGLTDADIINTFIYAKNQGKNVRILLQHYPYQFTHENEFAIKRLQNAHMNLVWPDGDFKLTHQKTLLTDHKNALVMTFNFTHMAFTKERNFGLLLTDANLVNEIQNVFNADYKHQPISVKETDLIWSPDNAEEKLLHVIRDAKKSLKIYAQSVNDYDIVGALAKAARDGVEVEIITSTKGNAPHSKLDYLRRAGVEIRFCREYLIHAKVILVDERYAVLGSINLTKASIHQNRELAVITRDPKIVKNISQVFGEDWQNTVRPSSRALRSLLRATLLSLPKG